MWFAISARTAMFRCASVALLLALCACVGSAIPVVDRTAAGGGYAAQDGQRSYGAGKTNGPRIRLGPPPSGKHTVKKGETLYSIAFAYGLSVKQLAIANTIRSPYTIKPGQKIALHQTKRSAAKVPNTAASTSAKSTVTAAKSSSKAKPRQSKKKPKSTVLSSNRGNSSGSNWNWPASGSVLSGYGENKGKGSANKGIDIAGKNGQAVRAARAGTVVYSGNGIQGYGNLIIVRHSSEYLSAYAYNRVLVVSEGEKVNVGQKIAEIGNSGSAKENKLHFEIRKSGQPVNPLKLLPKRG